jgi:oligopeptide/dipeptide ABC transporter ATP-binding protein
MVMYAGRQAELAAVDDLFYRPRHPYTAGLLASLPRVDRPADRSDRLQPIPGQPPSLVFRPPGCAFHPRCPHARLDGACVDAVPALRVVEPEHRSACHFAEEIFVSARREPTTSLPASGERAGPERPGDAVAESGES